MLLWVRLLQAVPLQLQLLPLLQQHVAPGTEVLMCLWPRWWQGQLGWRLGWQRRWHRWVWAALLGMRIRRPDERTSWPHSPSGFCCPLLRRLLQLLPKQVALPAQLPEHLSKRQPGRLLLIRLHAPAGAGGGAPPALLRVRSTCCR